jgi:hypothetical protein
VPYYVSLVAGIKSDASLTFALITPSFVESVCVFVDIADSVLVSLLDIALRMAVFAEFTIVLGFNTELASISDNEGNPETSVLTSVSVLAFIAAILILSGAV